MSDPQVWKIAVTPAQRWVLLQLAHEKGQKVKGQQGRVFRRFMRAFGLDVIDETIRAKGSIGSKMAAVATPSLFTVTAENADYAKGLADVERAPADETTIGPLFDALDEIKTAPEPEGVPAFDKASEDWSPVNEAADATTEEIIEKIAKGLESLSQSIEKMPGFTSLSEYVRSGAWDAEPDKAAP